MKINIIAACDRNGLIGIDGKIPWHIPSDLRRFRELTTGHAVIMGRKTKDSISNRFPLVDRRNFVVTSNPIRPYTDNFEERSSLAHALGDCEFYGWEPFVIGGERLYRGAMPLADKLYLTRVDREVTIHDGSETAYFPLELINDSWKLVSTELHTHRFEVYERKL